MMTVLFVAMVSILVVVVTVFMMLAFRNMRFAQDDQLKWPIVLNYSSTDCTCFFDKVASFKNSL